MRKRLFLIESDVKAVLLLVLCVVVGMTMVYLSSGEIAADDTAKEDSLAAENRKNSPFHRNDIYYKRRAVLHNDSTVSGAYDSSVNPSDDDGGYYGVGKPKRELFPFDPNTADSTQLLRLGLQPWQVRNIYKYRAAGGVYRQPKDFAKLYGLTVEHYRALEPYIRISSNYQPAATLFKDTLFERDTLRNYRDTILYPKKLKPSERLVLNTADTTSLKKVPGVGSTYARMIASYGARIGGYVSVDQLDEIEGLPDDIKSYFIIQDASPQRLNINRLPLSALRKHPYIGYFRAKAIVDYRNKNGKINSLHELRLLKDFTPDAIKRLEPYVEY